MKLFKLLMIALTLSVTSFLSAQTTCFSSDNNYIYEGASSADAIAKGDFNKDGKLDVVVINSTGAGADVNLKRLYYVENTGNRTFAQPVPFQSGSRVLDVKVGDVNNDGNLDVVIVNFNLDRIAVILGNGDGTFQAPIGYPTASIPTKLELIDLNNDGFLDVVVASNASQVNILLNNPATPGTYMPYQQVSYGGTFPAEIVAADFDGDGNPDIASINGNGTVSILKGDGAGNLNIDAIYPSSLPTGDDIVSGDFNGDGDIDVAVISSDHDQVSVLLNNGNGTLASGVIYSTGDEPKAIEIIDYNKDGNEDLAIVNANGNTVSILEGMGNGSFLTHTEFSSSGYPLSLVVGDFDGDGNEDIVVSTQLNQALPILFGDGNSDFDLGNIVKTGNSPYDITNNEFNGDGLIDFAVPIYNNNTVEVYKNEGLGNYSLHTTLTTGNNPIAITSGDFTGNGSNDIVVANYTDGTVSVFLNTGGAFSSPATVSVNQNPIKVKLGDYDNDGNLDLFVLNENNQVTILKGNGSGGFTNPMILPTGTTPKDIALGDQNGDGSLDFVVSCYDDNQINLFRGDGNGSFTKTDHTVGNKPWGIVLADINGDGKLEAVVVNNASNSVSVLAANPTNGNFSPTVTTHYQTQDTGPIGITAGDFNGDGLMDFAVTNTVSSSSTGTVSILTATGVFPPPIDINILQYDNSINVGKGPTLIQATDSDGNGSMDLLVVNQTSGHVSVLLNNTGTPIIVADGPTNICGSGSVTLTSTPAAAYLWSNGATTQSIEINTPGSYSVQTTHFGGCIGVSNVIEVETAPSPTLSFTGNDNICDGESTTITVSGADTYSWSHGLGTGNVKSLNPSVTTTYTVTGTVTTSGCTDELEITVTVNSAPDASFTGLNATYCENGLSSTLTPTIPGGTFNGPGISGNTFDPSVAGNGTHTITYEVTVNGCTNISSQNVDVSPGGADASFTILASKYCKSDGTVNLSPTIPGGSFSGPGVSGMVFIPSNVPNGNLGNPIIIEYTVTSGGCTGTSQQTTIVYDEVTPSFTNPGPVCSGDNFTLPSLSNNGINGTWSPAINNTVTTTYTFTPDPGECAIATTMTVVVNPLPTVSVSAVDNEICQGNSTTLTANGADSYTWSPATGLSSTTGNSVTANPTTTTTYTVTGLDGNGCQSSANVLVTVENPTTPTFTNPGPVCSGENFTLPTISNNGINGSWSPAINNTITTTYTFTPGPNECASTATLTVVVNELPTVTTSPNVGICLGATTTLTASGAATYLWSPSTGLDVTTNATVNASPANTTTYTVTGTDANGCENTASVVVTVGSLTVPAFTNPGPICSGENFTLPTISNNGINGSWSPAINNTATTTYTFTPDPNECAETITMSVVVNSLPVLSVTPDTEICEGSSTSLTASGASSYSWSPSTGLNATTGAIVNATPPSTTTYTVTGTDGNGCKNTAQITVTVNPLPTASISGNAEVCIGDTEPTITFTGANGTAPYTFTYNINGGANQTVSSTGNTATVLAPTNTDGTFTYNLVSVEDGSSTSCSQSQSGSVTITVNPLPTASISGNTDVCLGDGEPTITFTGANGTAPYTFTYNINSGANQTVISTGNTATITAPTTTDGTFTYNLISVEDASSTNCSQSQSGSVTITVNPLPTVSVSTADAEICEGASTTLTASGADSYSWSPATGSSVLANPTTTTTYTVTGTDNNGCQNTAQITVIVNPLPTASISGNTEVCLGETEPTITFTGANGTAPYIFTYNIDGGANQTVISTGNTATITAPTTTDGIFTYNLISVEDASSTNCSQSQSGSVTIIVNPLPTVSVSTADVEICEGASTTLTASGADSYSWSPTTGLSATTGASVTANPANTTTYTVTGTDINGCQNTAQITVIVNPLPTASISGNTEVCLGETEPTITFTGANGTAPYTFTYNIDGGANQTITSSGNTATITAPTTTDGTFTYNLVSVEDASSTSCSQSQSGSVTITVNPLPTASISGNTDVCLGDGEPTITFTGANGTAPYIFTYNIDGGANQTVISTGNTATITAPTTTDGIFTYNLISVEDASSTNCSQSQSGSVTITVNPLPTVSVSTADAEICEGASTTLTASGAVSYSWSPAAGLSATTGASVTANPTTTTTYTVTGTDNNGCQNTAQVTVIVNPIPTASISGSTDVCLGDVQPTVTFTGANGTAPYTFTYTIDGGANQTVTSSGNTATITAPTTTDGTFTYNLVSVEDASSTNCSQNQSGSVTIIVNPLPTVSVSTADAEICEGASTTLTASGAVSYSWSPAAGLSATTGASVTANPTTTTTYTVTGTDNNGCQNTAQITVIVNPLPTASISGNTEVCLGETEPTITFTGANGTAPYIFTYNIDGGANQTVISTGNTATITAPTTTDGTFTYNLVSVEDDSQTQCSQTQTGTVTITVNPLPIASVTGDTEVCLGDGEPTITFTGANGTAPYTFTYNINSGANQTVISTGNTATITAPTTTDGTFTYNLISVEDASSTNCSQSQSGSVTITVNPLPIVTVNANLTTICSGGVSVLMASGANTYSWSPSTGLNTTVGNLVTAQPTSTTIYTVIGTDINGCENTATFEVVVAPSPIATFTGLSSVYCVDETPSVLTPIEAGGVFSGNGIINGNEFDPSIAGVGVHTITYTLTNSNECQATSTQLVEVTHPSPATIIGVNNQYCNNENPVILNAIPTGGTFTIDGTTVTELDPSLFTPGTYTLVYQVDDTNSCNVTTSKTFEIMDAPDATFSGLEEEYCFNDEPTPIILNETGGVLVGSGINFGVFNPADAGVGTHLITHTVTGANGCSDSYSFVVTVTSLPNANFSGLSNFYCSSEDSVVNLIPAVSGGTFNGPGINGNTWEIGNANNGQNIIEYEITINGCTNSSNKVVKVIQSPDANFTGLDTAYCSNQEAIEMNPTHQGGYFTGTGISAGKFHPSLADIGNNTITYTVINGAGCESSFSMDVEVFEPITSTITINGDVLTADYTEEGITYQWINCDSNTIIEGAINQEFKAPSTGNYAVIINNGSCQTTSQCVKLFVTGLEDLAFDKNKVKVYPNPNNGNFIIEATEYLDIELFNTMGQIVYRESQEAGMNQIKLGFNIETGLYILKLTNKKGYSHHKNIVINHSIK